MSSNARYTVKFPLELDTTQQTGYEAIGSDSLHELVNFNIKNVLMTMPGERTWDTSFGVGLNQLLFEQFEKLELGVIESQIRTQINTYVPYIHLNEVSFAQSPDQETLGIRLRYTIAQVNTVHVLGLTFGSNAGAVGEMFVDAYDKDNISDRLIGDVKTWGAYNQ